MVVFPAWSYSCSPVIRAMCLVYIMYPCSLIPGFPRSHVPAALVIVDSKKKGGQGSFSLFTADVGGGGGGGGGVVVGGGGGQALLQGRPECLG